MPFLYKEGLFQIQSIEDFFESIEDVESIWL